MTIAMPLTRPRGVDTALIEARRRLRRLDPHEAFEAQLPEALSLIASSLVAATGSKLMPAIPLVAAGIIGAIAVYYTRETAGKPMPGSPPSAASQTEAHDTMAGVPRCQSRQRLGLIRRMDAARGHHKTDADPGCRLCITCCLQKQLKHGLGIWEPNSVRGRLCDPHGRFDPNGAFGGGVLGNLAQQANVLVRPMQRTEHNVGDEREAGERTVARRQCLEPVALQQLAQHSGSLTRLEVQVEMGFGQRA